MQKNTVALASAAASYNHNHISTVSLLITRFAERPIIPFTEALGAVSIHVPTARNQCSAGTFPIPTIRRGKRLFIELAELVKYVEKSKIKRGRKSKAEKYASNQQGDNKNG